MASGQSEQPRNERTVTTAQVDAQHRAGDGVVELVISWLLRIGVWSSVTVIVVGLIMLVTTQQSALLQAHRGGLEGLLKDGIPGQPASITAYADVFASVGRGQPFGVIMLGLLILLLTPVLRVAVSIVAFLLEKDRLYTAITIVVLALLLTGVALGKAGG